MCCQRSGRRSRLIQRLYGNVSLIIPVGGFAMALVILSAFSRVVLERLRRCVSFQRGRSTAIVLPLSNRYSTATLSTNVNTFLKMSFRPPPAACPRRRAPSHPLRGCVAARLGGDCLGRSAAGPRRF